MNIFENNFKIIEDTVVTLGKFDGLHEGHRKLINLVLEKAKEYNYKSLVYTFNQNPSSILNDKEIKMLMTKEEKINILKRMGIDYIVFENFTYDFSTKEPEEFVKEIIKEKLNAKVVIVGKNYRFGKEKKGDVDLLKKLGFKYDFKIIVINLIKENGEVISSSALREKLISH